MFTFDKQTIDSTGAFLIGELERLDQTLHLPLVDYKWSRDIDLRGDVSIADDATSFTNSSFAAPGGVNTTGKNWISKNSSAIAGIQVDIAKTLNPLMPWGMELAFTIFELESAAKLGRPIDAQKLDALKLKFEMDTDEQVYIGDSVLNLYGLFNNTAKVTPANVDKGAQQDTTWASKTQQEILADVNAILYAGWAASGFKVCPDKLRLDPLNFAAITAQPVTSAGSVSTLKFLEDNSICLRENGRPLEVLSSKWLTGRGANATNRMVAYTKRPDLVRFSRVPIQRTPVEYKGIYQLATYYSKLGVVEMVYPETIVYRDGI
jgi:hypothetical protein